MPRVSVILPAYHSYDTLASCLAALRAQTLEDREVIVVNSSPEDRTRAVAEPFPAVRFEQSSRRLLPHAARNRGVELASGELLAFTDPDCEPDPAWLERLVAAQEGGHPVVAGSIDPAPGDPVSIGMHLVKFHWRLSRLPPARTDLVQTANACYSRPAWEAVGPFDGKRFSGDILLSKRAANAGFEPWFEPRARVVHRQEGDWRDLLHERLVRGGDGAATRIEADQWSRARIAAYLAGAPLISVVLVARAARDAARCGFLRSFIQTLPLQLAAQAAWALGEARCHGRILTRSAIP